MQATIICLISMITFGFLVQAVPDQPAPEPPYSYPDISRWDFPVACGIPILAGLAIWYTWEDREYANTLTDHRRYNALRHSGYFWFRLFFQCVGSVVTILRPILDKSTLACTKASLNPDIGGIGVLVGLYVPGLLVFLSLVLGHFTGSDTGTKELGNVALMSRFY